MLIRRVRRLLSQNTGTVRHPTASIPFEGLKLDHLYLTLGNIALVFSTIVGSNTTFAAPAGRDSEIAPTSGFGRFAGIDSMTEESIVVQMRSQSNRLWYGNL